MSNKSSARQYNMINPALRGAGYSALEGPGGANELFEHYRTTPLPSTYVGISPERESALQSMLSTAEAGAVPNAAVAEYMRTVGGEYLSPDSNPHLQEIVRRSVGESLRSAPGAFAGGGRFGSGAYANAVADTAQETAARIYGGAYESERSRMLAALGLAPTAEALEYAPAERMAGVGSAYEQDELMRRMEELRQYYQPAEALGMYQSLLGGNPLTAESTQRALQTEHFNWGQAIVGAIGGLLGGGGMGGGMGGGGGGGADAGAVGGSVGGGLGSAIGALALLCHAAAEYFGWATPKWWAARRAIVRGDLGDKFLEWYAQHSADLAANIRSDPNVREEWRPLFERAAELGA